MHKVAICALFLSSILVTTALAEGETYTIHSETLVYRTSEALRKAFETLTKTRAASGGPSEATIKNVALDMGEDRAYIVAKGTECISLEDQAFMGETISTISIKGKGVGYTLKSQISPKLK